MDGPNSSFKIFSTLNDIFGAKIHRYEPQKRLRLLSRPQADARRLERTPLHERELLLQKTFQTETDGIHVLCGTVRGHCGPACAAECHFEGTFSWALDNWNLKKRMQPGTRAIIVSPASPPPSPSPLDWGAFLLSVTGKMCRREPPWMRLPNENRN